jgi:hypothetical protein
MVQRFAVVVRASDPSQLPAWAAARSGRNWSLVVACDPGGAAAFQGRADLVAPVPAAGPRWPALAALLAARPDLWQGFELLWFPEPGLEIDPALVDSYFEIVAALGLHLSQPAVHWDGHPGNAWAGHNAQFHLRYTNYIGAAAPCLSREFLGRVLAQAGALAGPLEFALPRLLGEDPRRCALLDAIQVRRAADEEEAWQLGAGTPAAAEGDALPLSYGALDRDGKTLSLFDDSAAQLIRGLRAGLAAEGTGVPPAMIHALVVAHERARSAAPAPARATPPTPAALPAKPAAAPVLAGAPHRPRVFIYNELITDPALREINVKLAQLNNLGQHLQYLEDYTAFFRRYETDDPAQADFFFVPLFLAGWQFANRDPWDFIQRSCPHLARGNHVLLASGDFGQRAETRHEMSEAANPQRAYNRKYPWLDARFRLIALESTASLLPQDVAFLPYCTRRVEPPAQAKDLLASFMGRMSYPFLAPAHLRGRRLLEWRATLRNPAIVVGEVAEVQVRLGRMVGYDEVMARSVFTLCPAGYGRWSFRFVEALLNESIPVLLADDYVLPFADAIAWEDYGYVVPEAQLDGLEAFLAARPAGEVQAKLASIRRDRRLFEREFTQQRVLAALAQPAPAAAATDPAEAAIARMRGPERMGIICVDVTNKCDLACSNCTRLLVNQDHYWEMSPENFRMALRSLRGYPGIIAMIGGNPCMHTKFEELCRIFREEIPEQRQRGLWTNNIFKHAAVIEATFGGLNLNPHENARAVGPLRELYQRMVVQRGHNGGYYEGHSEHAPLMTAVRDLYGEREMWERIAGCDINRDWSASIVQNQGELRAYFCEVAASFDLARNEDHGLPVTPGWWRKPLQDFAAQVRRFCPGCGVPARLKGHMDHEEIDTYTVSNADIAAKAARAKKRKVILLRAESQADLGHRVTKYAGNAPPATPAALCQ